MAPHELPEHIISEILLRLPVYALVRFKCVCSAWLREISDSRFHKSHLNHHRSLNYSGNAVIIGVSYPKDTLYKPGLIIGGRLSCSSSPKIMTWDVEICLGLHSSCYCYLNFHSCCDGILCAIAVADFKPTLLLWNPSINECKRFEARCARAVYGLGYDSTVEDYKVVSFPDVDIIHNQAETLQVHVLTLRTNTWRRVADMPNYMIRCKPKFPVVAHGGLHWLMSSNMNDANMIVRFDLAKETFTKFATLPPDYDASENIYCLGLLRNNFCVLIGNNIWVLKDEGPHGEVRKEWSKVLAKLPLYFDYPICITSRGEVVAINEELHYDCCRSTDELLKCDPEQGTVNKLAMYTGDESRIAGLAYTESLISIK